MANLTAIMGAVRATQDAITPPAGEKQAVTFEEPPEIIGAYPSWVSVERRAEPIQYDVGASGARTIPFLIDLHLIFSTADKWYSRKTARTWMAAVLAAFEGNLQLDGTVRNAFIAAMQFGALDLDDLYPNSEYSGITFNLRAVSRENVAIIP